MYDIPRKTLVPMAQIPARELWLYENPEAIDAVRTGLKQAREGKIVERASFARHADDDI